MAKNIMLATVLLLVIWAGSFGIALGVVEWRGGKDTVIRETTPITAAPTDTLSACDKLLDAYYHATNAELAGAWAGVMKQHGCPFP